MTLDWRRALVGAMLAGLAACAGGPSDGAEERDDALPETAGDLEEDVEALPGVVEADAERAEEDTEYWVLRVEVIVEDDIDSAALTTVVRTLDVGGRRIEAHAFHAQVRLARDADAEEGELVSTLRMEDHPGDPRLRAEAFLTAMERFPEAIVSVDSSVLSIDDIDPRGLRVSEVLAEIAADPVLGELGVTALTVKDSVEGLPSAQVLVDGPVTEVAGDHWQSVVDAVATTPAQAAPRYAYVLVRDDALDVVEISLGGDLTADVTPDFATWQPVLTPMVQAVLTLTASAAHEDGSEVDFMTEAGDFASVWIEDGASDGGYADPTWSQWAADLLNAQ